MAVGRYRFMIQGDSSSKTTANSSGYGLQDTSCVKRFVQFEIDNSRSRADLCIASTQYLAVGTTMEPKAHGWYQLSPG